jgi:hypothetical protein
MQHLAVLAQRLLAGCRQNLLQIVEFDFLAAEIDRRGVDVAAEAAGRQIDDQALDGQPAMRSAASTARRMTLPARRDRRSRRS